MSSKFSQVIHPVRASGPSKRAICHDSMIYGRSNHNRSTSNQHLLKNRVPVFGFFLGVIESLLKVQERFCFGPSLCLFLKKRWADFPLAVEEQQKILHQLMLHETQQNQGKFMQIIHPQQVYKPRRLVKHQPHHSCVSLSVCRFSRWVWV